MSRPDRYAAKKGRGHTPRFVQLHFALLRAPAYRGLSTNARALMIELLMLFRGDNNGELFLSVRDAADRLGHADHRAAQAAFEELIKSGFIEIAEGHRWAAKDGAASRARKWRLTWLHVAGKRGPTNEFEAIEPDPGTPARKRMERGLRALKRQEKTRERKKSEGVETTTLPGKRVVESTTVAGNLSPERPVSVEETTTRFGKNPGNPSVRIVEESTTHIEIPSIHVVAQSSEVLRAEVIGYLSPTDRKLAWGAAGRLANRACLREAELSKFRHGSTDLTPEKRVRLAQALNEVTAEDAAALMELAMAANAVSAADRRRRS